MRGFEEKTIYTNKQRIQFSEKTVDSSMSRNKRKIKIGEKAQRTSVGFFAEKIWDKANRHIGNIPS